MQAVNVQEIYRAVEEMRQGFVEARSHQAREARIFKLVAGIHASKHGFIVESGVLIPLPGIDREAPRWQPQGCDRLTK